MARPASSPSTILRAARSASMETTGKEAAVANHAYSFSLSPEKYARSCEPVRIRPGTMVVAVTPDPANSAASPSENPTAPNLAVA